MGLRKHPEHVRHTRGICSITVVITITIMHLQPHCLRSYSNLENHPNLLRETPAAARIRISKKVSHAQRCA